MKKKETKESSYLAIINNLSEDIGITTEETKGLVDVALSSVDSQRCKLRTAKTRDYNISRYQYFFSYL